MMKDSSRISRRNKSPVIWITMAVLLISTQSAAALENAQNVRVGWHEEPYCIMDDSGRRSGYTYEYQQKIAAYTGWNYEYVEGSWADLIGMIKTGEIDLLGNVSYSDARAKEMLYASLPMGTETYCLFTSAFCRDIKADDYATLSGKKVAVARESIQAELFRNWEKAHGVKSVILELDDTETEMMLRLGKDFDALVTMDVYANNTIAVPVWKIDSSDFFFAVSKHSAFLLDELNRALSRIQDENESFNHQLYEKYLKNTENNLYLTEREKNWLYEHGPIRIGYQDNYLAFCAYDKETGELTGALKDYLDSASTALKNAYLTFETHPYPSIASAIEAMKNGEVDCVFPANMKIYDSEVLGLVMTPPLVRTEMDAVVRASEKKEFLHKEHVIVAVNAGNTNYDLFLQEHFPTWEPKYFLDTPTGLEAIARGEADCVILSNYRFNNISRQCEKLHLTTAYTGVNMDYYIALPRGETDLYSILTRITTTTPDASVHTALTYYSTEDVKESLLDVLGDNFFIVVIVVIVILLIILSLILHSIRAEKKALEEARKVNSLNRMVYIDALTSVRNKGAFDLYLKKLQEKMDSEGSLKFAVGILDCDNLKNVNDNYGHDKGDIYIKTATSFICNTFQHSPVFRIGGDEFAVILQNDDYTNKDFLLLKFEAGIKETWSIKENLWEQVHISIGVAVYNEHIDHSVNDTVRRADSVMYKNKRERKA